jgi:hypothetical protein
VSGLPVASFKLQIAERRVRIVPARDAAGCPFEGPGVDLVGDEADAQLPLARPLLAWLQAREAVEVRSLSLDVSRRRVLVTVAASPRPRVVKIDPAVDPSAAEELVALAAPLLERLGRLAAEKLSARPRLG